MNIRSTLTFASNKASNIVQRCSVEDLEQLHREAKVCMSHVNGVFTRQYLSIEVIIIVV